LECSSPLELLIADARAGVNEIKKLIQPMKNPEIKIKTLIAEDDLTSRNILAAVLGKYNFDIITTVNGAQALEAMREPDPPKLVILDWMMPEMTGIQVVRRIHAEYRETPPYIIMLTTKNERTDIIAGLDAGADDYLTKPFDIGELRSRIQVGRRMIETQQRLATKIQELNQALAHVEKLKGILPICMHCKKIRNDQGYWDQVETYVRNHSRAEFSHAICPECLTKYYED
jgi:sigma-B regulation protein RsbU (phosphoserine phosphatase)